MNILQIKPLAERFGCTIDTVRTSLDDGDQVVVSKGELQRIFESVSGVSLRDWWSNENPLWFHSEPGSEAKL